MRARRPPPPPAGLSDHVSRRQAAELLGFASEFPVRQLEKAGRLRAVRGAMGQAWYPREDVLALRTAPARRMPAREDGAAAGASARGRWPDSALIALLREMVPGEESGRARPRTAVDLVADTGISIARAVRVHRFWLAHDLHPTADIARGAASAAERAVVVSSATPKAGRTSFLANEPVRPAAPAERRGANRLERDVLIRKLRDPDPAVRALAFEKLRPDRKPGG